MDQQFDANLAGATSLEDIFVKCYLQALALSAINPIAYLLIEKDKMWEPNSVWENVEYHALTTNPNIEKIIRADPSPGACDAGETVLWQKGRDESRPSRWLCPLPRK